MFLQNCSCNTMSAESVIASYLFVIFASRGGLGGGVGGGLGGGLYGGLGGGLDGFLVWFPLILDLASPLPKTFTFNTFSLLGLGSTYL